MERKVSMESKDSNSNGLLMMKYSLRMSFAMNVTLLKKHSSTSGKDLRIR